jgi:hypothetical protein
MHELGEGCMGVTAQWARRKSADRAHSLLCAGDWRHRALNIFAALVFLTGAIVPLRHHARAKETATATAAELQSLLGVSAEELGASICHHEDGRTSELPGDEESRLCKEHCALFLTLQYHTPAFIPDGLAWPARGRISVAAIFAHRAALKAGREPEGQARPRAPPASFDTAIV